MSEDKGYSYEYSYEYESTSEDSDQPLTSNTRTKPQRSTPKSSKEIKPKSPAERKPAQGPRKATQRSSESASPKSERAPTREARTRKDDAIAALLSRWWYVLPPWPLEDWDYQKQLEE